MKLSSRKPDIDVYCRLSCSIFELFPSELQKSGILVIMFLSSSRRISLLKQWKELLEMCPRRPVFPRYNSSKSIVALLRFWNVSQKDKKEFKLLSSRFKVLRDGKQKKKCGGILVMFVL